MTLSTGNSQPPGFIPVSLSQMDRIESIRISSGNTLYSYTFTSLFAWKDDEKYEVGFADDAFIVKNGALGDNAYYYPCGSENGKRKLLESILNSGSPEIYYVTDEDKAYLEQTYPGRFDFAECREDFAYLYDKREQIELNGKAYKHLRHQINLGRAAARNWSCEQLSDSNAGRAMALNHLWARNRGNEDPADIAAAQTALSCFSQLGMWGMIFLADGTDTAYAAGSFITPDIFDINFCKVLDNRCDCYVKWALYCALPDEVKTVDSEDDMGLEGLRRHKLLRLPKELTRVWKGSLSK